MGEVPDRQGLAAKVELKLQIADQFNQIDSGSWTNRRVGDLDKLPEWQQWIRSAAAQPCPMTIDARSASARFSEDFRAAQTPGVRGKTTHVWPWARAIQSQGGEPMLRWAVIFLIIAIVAALFGFTGIAAGAAAIAKFLFGLFLLLCLIFFILAISAGRRVL